MFRRAYRTNRQFRNAVDRAVELHAANNRADPFAAGRMKLHLLQGLEEVGAVIKDESARAKHS